MSDRSIDIKSVLESKKALLQGKKSLALDSFTTIYNDKDVERESSKELSEKNKVNVRLVAENLKAEVKSEVGVKKVYDQYKNWETKRAALKKSLKDVDAEVNSGSVPIYRQIIANSAQK